MTKIFQCQCSKSIPTKTSEVPQLFLNSTWEHQHYGDLSNHPFDFCSFSNANAAHITLWYQAKALLLKTVKIHIYSSKIKSVY